MNKWYFGLPLVAVLAFAAYFWNFNTAYEADKKKQADAAWAEKMEISRKEQEERRRLAEQAAKDTEKRQAERAAEKARLAKEEQDRQDARQKRVKASSDVVRLKTDLQKIKRDIEDEEKLVQKAKDEKAGLETERTFLTNYIQMAKRNRDRMFELVAKFDEAEAARKKAADAAAAAAKGK